MSAWSTEYLIQRWTFDYEDQPAITVGYVLEVPLAEFSGVHNDLSGRSTTAAHPGTAVSIDPAAFVGNLDGTITNAQLLAAAVDDLTVTGGGGGGGQTVGYEVVSTGFPASITGDARSLIVAGADNSTVTLRAAVVADVGQRWHIYAPVGDIIVDGLVDPAFTIPAGHVTVVIGVDAGGGVYGWSGAETVPVNPTTGGATALNDLTDVDTTTDPPAADDVLAWDAVNSEWSPATLDGGTSLSDATPQDLGTAAAGDGTSAARDDHVHDMPTASQISVDASGFNGNLASTDDTVQEVAQKLDDLVTGGTETLPASIIDAKGDLIVGTAADTAARLAVSATKGHVLTVDSAQSTGVKWAPAGRLPAVAANDYVLLSSQMAHGYGIAGTSGSALNSNNFGIFGRYDVDQRIGVDALAIHCTQANDGASAVVRLGLYADNAGRPGTVVVDAGTSSINATGIKTLTFTEVFLEPGPYHYFLVVQGLNTSGNNPLFSSGGSSTVKQGEPTPQASNAMFPRLRASASGGLANNPTVSFSRMSVDGFHVWMRVSTP